MNEENSKVARRDEIHFLGFRLRKAKERTKVEVLISNGTKERMDAEIRELTPRMWGQSRTGHVVPEQHPGDDGAYRNAWFHERLVSLVSTWQELNLRPKLSSGETLLFDLSDTDPKSPMCGPQVRFYERPDRENLQAYSTMFGSHNAPKGRAL